MSPFAATVEACPSESQLLALIRGELPPGSLAPLLAHTERCSDCALVVAQAGSVLAEPDGQPASRAIARAGAVFSPGQLVASRYLIERRVGRGGMGEVYAALDRELNDRVALKTISTAFASDPSIVERFKLELRLARRIAHPSVCRVFEFGRHELGDGSSQCFFTLQFIYGATLRRRLLEDRSFPLLEAATLLRNLALGLQAIHEQRVVHRDIKPENVMLTSEDGPAAAIWVDFGLARVDLRETTSGGLAGTPDYLAPELLAGGVASRASDIYAFGVVMYEVLTGALPFARAAAFPAASKGHRVNAPAPSARRRSVPAPLDALVRECLDSSPEQRPASARHVADRLFEVANMLHHDSETMEPRIWSGGAAVRALRRARLPLCVAIAAATGAALALYRADGADEVPLLPPIAATVGAPRPSPAPDLPANNSSVVAPAAATAAERTAPAVRSAGSLAASSRPSPSAVPDYSRITDFGGRR